MAMSPDQLDVVERTIQENIHLEKLKDKSKHNGTQRPRESRDLPNAEQEFLGNMDADFEAILSSVEVYTEEHIPHLRSRWIFRCKDIMGGAPDRPPPFVLSTTRYRCTTRRRNITITSLDARTHLSRNLRKRSPNTSTMDGGRRARQTRPHPCYAC